jgi:succinate dehydrogenase / fumarate reductase cytochrome b subunit
MSDLTRPTRPTYRNIHISQIVAYRLPAAGWISILHRISGALLFVLLPFVLYLFDRSLTSVGTFETMKSLFAMWPVKIVVLALIWAYLQHFCAGVRHLFMDVHLGLEKHSTNATAISVMVVTFILWVAFALKTFGAF